MAYRKSYCPYCAIEIKMGEKIPEAHSTSCLYAKNLSVASRALVKKYDAQSLLSIMCVVKTHTYCRNMDCECACHEPVPEQQPAEERDYQRDEKAYLAKSIAFYNVVEAPSNL